jgi:hypothetical protein
MNKSFLRKSVVALLCLGFILVAVPMMNSAERKAPKVSIIQLVKLPSLLISSAFPYLGSIVDLGTVSATPAKGPNGGKVKPTDVIEIPKPSTGD